MNKYVEAVGISGKGMGITLAKIIEIAGRSTKETETALQSTLSAIVEPQNGATILPCGPNLLTSNNTHHKKRKKGKSRKNWE